MKPCFEKYKDLEMSDHARKLLIDNPVKFTELCNGVGSRVGWFNKLIYHFIPDTIWLLDITPCSDIHDVEYEVPAVFETTEDALEWKHNVDRRFKRNLFKYIEIYTCFKWLERLRKCRANSYKFLVSHCGETSFMSGKIILNPKKIEYEFDPKKLEI